MTDPADRLRWILEQEVALHRELVRLAHLRHLLLSQEKCAQAAEVAAAEAACIAAVRDLERSRSRLSGCAVGGAEMSRLRRKIGILVRRLAALERASGSAWLTPADPPVAWPADQAASLN